MEGLTWKVFPNLKFNVLICPKCVKIWQFKYKMANFVRFWRTFISLPPKNDLVPQDFHKYTHPPTPSPQKIWHPRLAPPLHCSLQWRHQLVSLGGWGIAPIVGGFVNTPPPPVRRENDKKSAIGLSWKFFGSLPQSPATDVKFLPVWCI